MFGKIHRAFEFVPPAWMDVPSMNSRNVNEYLCEIGRAWRGMGVAVECGCWLGGGTVCLATGLRQARYDRPLYCYDSWQASGRQVDKARAAGVEVSEGEDILPIFQRNLKSLGVEVIACKGKIQNAHWTDGPIEVFILDAAKRYKAFFKTLSVFGPAWIPGVTIVGFMDLYHYQKVKRPYNYFFIHQHEFMVRESHCFSLMREFRGDEPAFYRYLGGLAFDRGLS